MWYNALHLYDKAMCKLLLYPTISRFLLVIIFQIFKWRSLQMNIASIWRYDISTTILSFFHLYYNYRNDWYWGMLSTNIMRYFFGGSCHPWFIMCIFEPILILKKKLCLGLIIGIHIRYKTPSYCSPCFLVRIICLTMSLSPSIVKRLLALIKVVGVE